MLVWTILTLCVVASTADSTKSFLGEIPTAPEMPTVIPAGSQLPARIPSRVIEAPETPSGYQALVTSTSTPVTTTNPAPVTSTTAPVTITCAPVTFTTPTPVTSTTAPVIISSTSVTTTSAPKTTTNPVPVSTTSTPVTSTTAPVTTTLPPVPPKPYFNRTLHLRVELSVPASDYSEAYDVEYHAESNTARTTVDDAYAIYRGLTGDGKVQYFKIELTRQLGSSKRYCTQSPALPASPIDSIFPGLPDLEMFDFVGYKIEGRNVEHWQHVVVGGPGEIGAARGESLNYTHDFFLYRAGGDAVPFKYTVTTDSSVLGVADSYTHRYTLLPPPTSPLLPDRGLCDVVMDYKPGMPQGRHVSLTQTKA